MEKVLRSVELAIAEATQRPYQILKYQAVGGGCINQSFRIYGATECYFLKVNRAECSEMFVSEAQGLTEIASSRTIKAPNPIAYGACECDTFLALEWFNLQSADDRSEQKMGEQLAQMHAQPKAYYGWHRENTIGATRQINTRQHDWISFWRDRRLAFQLNLAKSNGYGGELEDLGLKLCSEIERFFETYSVYPSLLHGDLWSGNAAADELGDPVVFDPACYYGDREADLAMTELFGGFGQKFYQAYNTNLPLDPGYKVRKGLYNLYHVLNHLNLFGSGYLGQAQSIIRMLLAETKG